MTISYEEAAMRLASASTFDELDAAWTDACNATTPRGVRPSLADAALFHIMDDRECAIARAANIDLMHIRERR